MTDREELEFAAKAAGLHVGFGHAHTESGRYELYWSHDHHQLTWHDKTAGSEYPEPVFWNPLTDDGDALRLAVKLKMTVTYVANETWPDVIAITGHQITEQVGTDPYAATRRAIVRAAAEIGRRKI